MTATFSFVSDTLTPVRAYAALRHGAGDAASFLLESVVGGERWGRYSILGYRPRQDSVLLPSGEWRVSGSDAIPPGKDPLEAAEPLFRATDDPAGATSPAAKLARAQVGYLAWDLVHAITRVPGWGDRITTPLARFFGGATIVVFDGLTQTVTIAAEDPADIARARRDLDHPPQSMTALPLPDRSRLPAAVDIDVDDARFERMVARAKEYIAAG